MTPSHDRRSAAALEGGRPGQSDGEGAGNTGRHARDPPADRRGLNINITLLFSVSVYEQVVDAYISGLEDLARAGGDVAKIGSVASVFVSRIDTVIDGRLDKLGDRPAADRLRGKAAIANAKLAYLRYKVLFSGPRWLPLAASGAKTQRLLWASTGTKNPSYKDTMYVEALIGRDTVDTIPPATMDAFRDHGEAAADVIERDIAGARAILAELEQRGISLEGGHGDPGQGWSTAVRRRLRQIARRRRAGPPPLLDGERDRLEIASRLARRSTAAVEAEMEAWRRGGSIRRLWAGDTSLWTGTDEDKWLGWLHIVEQELVGGRAAARFCRRREAARIHRRRPAGHGRIEPGSGSAWRDLRAAGRLAVLPHAGQHRSGADQAIERGSI